MPLTEQTERAKPLESSLRELRCELRRELRSEVHDLRGEIRTRLGWMECELRSLPWRMFIMLFVFLTAFVIVLAVVKWFLL